MTGDCVSVTDLCRYIMICSRLALRGGLCKSASVCWLGSTSSCSALSSRSSPTCPSPSLALLSPSIASPGATRSLDGNQRREIATFQSRSIGVGEAFSSSPTLTLEVAIFLYFLGGMSIWVIMRRDSGMLCSDKSIYRIARVLRRLQSREFGIHLYLSTCSSVFKGRVICLPGYNAIATQQS
jgi:hypothetical protein